MLQKSSHERVAVYLRRNLWRRGASALLSVLRLPRLCGLREPQTGVSLVMVRASGQLQPNRRYSVPGGLVAQWRWFTKTAGHPSHCSLLAVLLGMLAAG